MTLSINFDADEDYCYFAHNAETGECWNLPDLPNVSAAIAYLQNEYPQATIIVGDSASEL